MKRSLCISLSAGVLMLVLGEHLVAAEQKADESGKDKTSVPGEKSQSGGGFLGAYITEDTEDGGIVIDKTFPDGPAAKAGLVRGDKILRVGTKAINRRKDMFEALANSKPGDKITLAISRGEKEMTLKIVLAKWPPQTSQGSPGGQRP